MDIVGKIQTGEIRPGERLREQSLAAEYEVSRGPIREALHSLAAEYWVTLDPGKGARVTQSPADLDGDFVFIALRLSGLASRFAAVRATPEERDEIERLAREIADASMDAAMTPEAFSRLTWGLGGYILTVARSRSLEEQIRPLMRGGLVQMARHGVLTPPRRRAVARHWIDVALAIRARDGDRAETAHVALMQSSVKAADRASLHADLWQVDE